VDLRLDRIDINGGLIKDGSVKPNMLRGIGPPIIQRIVGVI
jgi:hypothetical protein